MINRVCIVVSAILISGCAAGPLAPERESLFGAHDFTLAPCPDAPNCVSTETQDKRHKIPPFRLKMPLEQAWPLIVRSTSELTRTSIEIEKEGYLFAEARSLIFRFIDNLEILAVPQENRLMVRSAAQLGYKDFSVNRDRVEVLRQKLLASGVIEEN